MKLSLRRVKIGQLVMLIDQPDFDSLPVKRVLIDRAGYAYVIWRKITVSAHGLAIRWSAPVRVHSWILPPKRNQVVDHINRNKLDNRRKNLRYVSRGTNIQNCAPRHGRKFKGVSLTPSGRSFIVNVGNRGCAFKACFKTESVAARVYDREAIRIYGSKAFLNFPGEDNSRYQVPAGELCTRKLAVSGVSFVYPDYRFSPPKWFVQRNRTTYGTFATQAEAIKLRRSLWQ